MEPFERIYDADYDAGDSDSVRGSDTSDEDFQDFDREMQKELDKRVGIAKEEKQLPPSIDVQQPELDSYSGEGSSGKEKLNRTSKKPDEATDSNDEALYDPNEDEDNERWAQKQRQSSIYAETKDQAASFPNSDAVLNCPGCMTVLCRDCQAHDTVAGQYRAMFVLNCKVDTTSEVAGPLVCSDRRKKRRRGESKQEFVEQDGTIFHPFHCNFCNTRIGVVDNEEIYHFLQVLAS